MTAINVNAAMSRVPKYINKIDSVANKAFMRFLCTQMELHVAEFNFRGIAEFMWGLGKMYYYPGDELMTKISNLCSDNI